MKTKGIDWEFQRIINQINNALLYHEGEFKDKSLNPFETFNKDDLVRYKKAIDSFVCKYKKIRRQRKILKLKLFYWKTIYKENVK